MSMSDRERETRDRVIEAAKQLFAAQGYHKTTIGDIAEACRYSPANIHRLFGTKSKIVEAIVDKILVAKSESAEEAVAEQGNASEKLARFVAVKHADAIRDFSQDSKIHMLIADATEEAMQPVRRYRLRRLALLESIIDEGNKSGEFNVPSVGEAALAVHMGMKCLVHPLLVAEYIGESDAGSPELFVKYALRSLGASQIT